MKFNIKLPMNCDATVLDIRRDEGDKVRIGDILFSYEADGALLFEYSAYNGIVTAVSANIGEKMPRGATVLTLEGDSLPKDTELFPS